jgi:zinc transport system substrate-binding protein
VSILPQQYFVARIGGDRVTVNVMVAPGAEPHTYEPKPDQLRALSNSKAYFTVGMPFEQIWLERFKAAAPETRIVDTAACVKRLAMAGEHADEAVKVNDQLLDPHIWLSPGLVKQQAAAIYAALAELDCVHQAEYKTNLDAFLADIDRLDADIRARLKGVQGRKFIVFHPAWGYFARDYGLEQIPIEIGGQEPSAADMARLIAQAREEDIKVIFAQPEFSTRAAETIAREIGGKVLLISPLDPDWLENMRRVAGAFAEVLSQ